MKIWVFLLQRPYSRTPLLSQALSIIFAVAAGAFSLTAAQPSDALLRIIPDVQQRLKSSNWTNRAEVLDLLVRRLPGSGKPEFESRHDLPRDDYGYVMDAVIEGLGQSSNGKPWPKLEELMPAWVYVIRTFRLDGTTDRIAHLLENTNDTLKGFSLAMLGALEAREYDVAIARLLQPENAQFHREARDLLVRFRSKEVVPALIGELDNEHYLPRYYALEALGKIADPSAIPALARSVLDPDEPNRTAALRALLTTFKGQNAETNVIPYARTVFRNSTRDDVICHALALMVDCGAPDSIQPVMERLTGTNDLARSLMDDALREVSPRIMVPAYISALESNEIYAGDPAKSDHVREYFITQLGRMKSRQGVPLLLQLSSKEQWYLRHFAIQALGEIGSPDAVPSLTNLLKERGNIHDETVVALFKIRDRRALPALKEYLSTPGLELGNLAFIFNYSVFPDVCRKISTQRAEFTMRGTPGDVLSRLSREMGIQINIKLPENQRTAPNAPVLPTMEMQKGHPMEGWLTLATTRLAEAYSTRFTYVIGDGEVFVVPNALLPETFLTIFDKMTNSK
jgi:HEAT repeat protein